MLSLSEAQEQYRLDRKNYGTPILNNFWGRVEFPNKPSSHFGIVMWEAIVVGYSPNKQYALRRTYLYTPLEHNLYHIDQNQFDKFWHQFGGYLECGETFVSDDGVDI